MNISVISNISFKSIPIYDVKVKKRDFGGGWEEIDATFSQMSSYDRHDRDTMKKLEKKWKKTHLMTGIATDFYQHRDGNNASYYAIELKDDSLNPEEKVLSLATVTNQKEYKYLDFLQSAPCIVNRSHPKYKGAGEVMIYGLVREAQNDNLKSIDLSPRKAAESFYNHIGFKEAAGPYYEIWQLSKDKFSHFAKRIERKYHFTHNEVLPHNE